MERAKLIRIFDKQASLYDKRREDRSQSRWRQELLSHATGQVLEVAVGAGANFPFYPPEVKITATDFSKAMLERAERAVKEYHLDVGFICSDIEEIEFPDRSFDTIVSTLSLCSYADPQSVLAKVNRWCRPDGKILMMEHGISSNLAIAPIQRALNPVLHRLYGCHHNRNIVGLVRESGMTIERVESYWLNMVKLIWARPKQ